MTGWRGILGGFLLVSAWAAAGSPDRVTVRVATYNLQNYLAMDRRVDGVFRPAYPKPEAEKAALRAVIREVRADVLALQEIGPRPYLEELRQDLEAEGLDYPWATLLEAADETRHLAVLSRFPPVDDRSTAELSFRYFGESETVKRGLVELVFETGGQTWSVFVVHLKSRFTDRSDDPESGIRRVGEARAIRDAMLERHPDPATSAFILMGDLNDTRASRTLAAFLQRGKTQILVDIPAINLWGQTWTHHYAKEEVYSRSDYLLVSPGMVPRVAGERAVVVESESAGLASDHRLVYLDLIFEPERPVGTDG